MNFFKLYLVYSTDKTFNIWTLIVFFGLLKLVKFLESKTDVFRKTSLRMVNKIMFMYLQVFLVLFFFIISLKIIFLCEIY